MRGFTILELVFCLLLAGLISLFCFPAILQAFRNSNLQTQASSAKIEAEYLCSIIESKIKNSTFNGLEDFSFFYTDEVTDIYGNKFELKIDQSILPKKDTSILFSLLTYDEILIRNKIIKKTEEKIEDAKNCLIISDESVGEVSCNLKKNGVPSILPLTAPLVFKFHDRMNHVTKGRGLKTDYDKLVENYLFIIPLREAGFTFLDKKETLRFYRTDKQENQPIYTGKLSDNNLRIVQQKGLFQVHYFHQSKENTLTCKDEPGYRQSLLLLF
mgnify:CR=1 FL=1